MKLDSNDGVVAACSHVEHHPPLDPHARSGLLAVAMIPLIAAAGVVQMAMLTGGYGDNDVRFCIISCFRILVEF